VRELLKLEPSQTCGFVRMSYISAPKIATEQRPIAETLAKKYPHGAEEIRSFPQPA
jgi:hypothetical protein